MELVTRTHHDRQEISLELVQDGTPLAHIYLPAAEAEAFAGTVGKHRAELLEEVPRELDPGSRLDVLIDPIWRTQVDKEYITLSLRHPGLGWLSFGLPPNEAKALGKWLLAQFE